MEGKYAGKSHVHKPEKGMGSYRRKGKEYAEIQLELEIFDEPCIYTVSYFGMDGSFNEHEYDTFKEASNAYKWIVERGGQIVKIYDDNGQEIEND